MSNEKDMHWRELCGKPFLSADLLPEPKDYKLTIIDASREEVFNPGSKKNEMAGIITFKETDKRLILNSTNTQAIVSCHGDRTLTWMGKQVFLYRTTCKLRGKDTPCIRIRFVHEIKNKNKG